MTNRKALLSKLETLLRQLARDRKMASGQFRFIVHQHELERIDLRHAHHYYRPDHPLDPWCVRNGLLVLAEEQTPLLVPHNLAEIVKDLVPDFGFVKINIREHNIMTIQSTVSIHPHSRVLVR